MNDTPKKPTDEEMLEEMERDTDAGTIEEEEKIEEKDRDATSSNTPKERR